MNSTDASATSITITADTKHIVVSDNGKGFAGKAEIERVFECFGTPHEAGDAIFGHFRMGRGQAFAFGKNTWRSERWAMIVDIDNVGLEYDLVDCDAAGAPLPFHQGCEVSIDLYEELLPSEYAAFARGIAQAVRYLAIPVTLNGQVINVAPATRKWDVVNEDAYIRRSATGPLKIFNLGVFVREYSNHVFATGGEIVSRQQLVMNMARNDVQQKDCPVWRRIAKHLRQDAAEKATKITKMTDGEREHYALQLIEGGITDYRVRTKLAVFTDVTGKHWTIAKMGNWLGKMHCTSVTVADELDARGDRLMQHGHAFVLSRDTLERFGVSTLPELVKRLADVQVYMPGKAAPFEKVAKRLSSDFRIVPASQWTETESIMLDVVQRNIYTLLRSDAWPNAQGYLKHRELYLGLSDCANGWTDGSSMVAIERSFLESCKPAVTGWSDLGRLMVHEYCHDESSEGSHIHTPDFYRTYHDVDKSGVIGRFVEGCMAAYPRVLESRGKKANKALLRIQDTAVRTKLLEATLERNNAALAKATAATPPTVEAAPATVTPDIPEAPAKRERVAKATTPARKWASPVAQKAETSVPPKGASRTAARGTRPAAKPVAAKSVSPKAARGGATPAALVADATVSRSTLPLMLDLFEGVEFAV